MRKVHARFAEFRWTIRVVWSSTAMFLTSAMCHVFEKTMVRVRDNCRCRQSWSMSPPSPFRNFAEYQQFCTLISSSILRSNISHFAFCFIPTPTTRWASKKNQSWTPAALGGKQFRWAITNPYGKKGQCILVLFYSLWYFVLCYSICYINCH